MGREHTKSKPWGNVAHLSSSPIQPVCGLSESRCPVTVCWEKPLVLILVKEELSTLYGLELQEPRVQPCLVQTA